MDKVVVIDDPVSGMDSSALFIVGEGDDPRNLVFNNHKEVFIVSPEKEGNGGLRKSVSVQRDLDADLLSPASKAAIQHDDGHKRVKSGFWDSMEFIIIEKSEVICNGS